MAQELYFILITIGLLILVVLAFFAGKALGKRYMFEVMNKVIDKERKDAVKKSRAVLGGQISEQLAPLLPAFPAQPSECRFIGKPIDFIAFRGLDEKEVSEIVFIEVKTGKSQMSSVQKSVQEAIQKRRVRFEEVKI